MTAEQLSAIRRGAMSLADMAAVGEHSRSCADCSRRILEAKPAAGVRAAIEGEDDFHLLPEELALYAESRLDAPRAAAAAAHVEHCDACRADLDDLRALVQPHRGRGRWWLAVAAALALVLIGAAIFIGQRKDEPRQQATPAPRHETAPQRAPETTTTIAVSPATDYGRDDWNVAVRRAIASGRIVVTDLAAVTRPVGGVRGPDGTVAAPHGMSPAGEITESETPSFSWNGKTGATYVVLVATPDGDVIESPPLDRPRWRITRPLLSGVTYSWQVQIAEGGRTVLVPAPPDPPALFRVAPADARAELQAARDRFPNEPLLLAVIAAKHGMMRVAREELDRHLAHHPTANAESLRASLEPDRR